MTIGNPQQWFEDGPGRPSPLNSVKRKHKYKAMLTHRGLWSNEEYKRRKMMALERHPDHRYYEFHRREIIPDCVIDIVRYWHPNYPSQPYMGHKWE